MADTSKLDNFVTTVSAHNANATSALQSNNLLTSIKGASFSAQGNVSEKVSAWANSKQDGDSSKNWVSLDQLTGDTVTALTNATIDAGANFLIGELTTPYGQITHSAEHILAATDTVANVVAGVSDAINNPQAVINDIAQIVKKNVTDELMSYTTTAFADVLKIDMNDLTGQIMKRTSEYTKSLTEIMQDITGFDKQFEEMDEKEQKEEESGWVDVVSDKVGGAKKKVNDFIETATGCVDGICTYIQNGPAWVMNQVNSYVNKGVLELEKYIGIARDEAIKCREDAINNIVEARAKKAADKANDIATKSAQKAQDKIKKTKLSATQKANAAIMKACNATVGLVGAAAGKAIKTAAIKASQAAMDAITKQLLG